MRLEYRQSHTAQVSSARMLLHVESVLAQITCALQTEYSCTLSGPRSRLLLSWGRASAVSKWSTVSQCGYRVKLCRGRNAW